MRELHEHFPDVKVNYTCDSPTSYVVLKLKYKGVRLTWKCSWKLLQASLDALAETCGVENKGFFPMEYIPDGLDMFFGPGEMPSIDDFCVHKPSLATDPGFLQWYEETKVYGYGNVRVQLIRYCEQDVRVLLAILKAISKVIIKEVIPEYFIFADLPTMAKTSHWFWLCFNTPDVQNCLEGNFPVVGLAPQYVYEIGWTSECTHLAVTSISIQREDDTSLLEWYDFATSCFKCKRSPDSYLALDCVHFVCPKTLKFEVSYPYCERMTIGTAKQKVHEIISKLSHLYQATVVAIYDCEMSDMLKRSKFKHGEILHKAEYLRVHHPEPFFTNLPIILHKNIYGGRVEAFSTGFDLSYKIDDDILENHTKAYKLDVVSLYPTVNSQNFYPGRDWDFFNTFFDGPMNALDDVVLKFNNPTQRCMTEQDYDERSQKIYPGMYTCKIDAPEKDFVPLLPCRVKGRLVFPTCRVCAYYGDNNSCFHDVDDRTLYETWTSNEIKFATDHGYVVRKIYNCVIWEGYVFQFAKEYFSKLKVLKLLASALPRDVKTEEEILVYFQKSSEIEEVDLDPKKQKTDLTLRFMVKILLNSLWGRWVLNMFMKTLTKLVRRERCKELARNTCRYAVICT